MSSGLPPGALSSASEYLAGREALHLERALRKGVGEAEKRTSAILESITDGLAVLDRDWRFTYVNSAWESLSGKTRQELLGHTSGKFFRNWPAQSSIANSGGPSPKTFQYPWMAITQPRTGGFR